MKKYYNELTRTIISEAEFIENCKEYIRNFDTEDGEVEPPDLEEVMLNTDYIYHVTDEEVEEMAESSRDGFGWLDKDFYEQFKDENGNIVLPF